MGSFSTFNCWMALQYLAHKLCRPKTIKWKYTHLGQPSCCHCHWHIDIVDITCDWPSLSSVVGCASWFISQSHYDYTTCSFDVQDWARPMSDCFSSTIRQLFIHELSFPEFWRMAWLFNSISVAFVCIWCCFLLMLNIWMLLFILYSFSAVNLPCLSRILIVERNIWQTKRKPETG